MDKKNKIRRDGYGAWIEDPAKAVRKAVKENITGVFINIGGSTKTVSNSTESSSSTTTVEQVEQFKRDFEKKLASEQADVPPEFEETFRKHWQDILA